MSVYSCINHLLFLIIRVMILNKIGTNLPKHQKTQNDLYKK